MKCQLLFLVALLIIAINTAINAQVQIQGKVLVDNNVPAENIKIVFNQIAPSTSSDSTYTSNDGSYSISLTKGVYNISYSKIGYDPQNVTSQSFYANKTLVDITLKASARIDLIGNLKGILNIGTYNSSNITVAEGDSLFISQGVVINFLENCTFQIKGKLLAIGSYDKPIKFTSLDITKKWSGAFLSNSQSKLENIIIEQSASSGLQIDNCSNITLNKMTIQNNHNGVTLHNSNIVIFNKCSFLNNNDYGGLTSESSSLKVYHCIFVNNNNVVHCPSSCYGFDAGGAINLAEWAASSNSLEVYNSIFKSNAGNYVINANGFTGNNNTIKIANSIFYTNSASAVKNYGNCMVEHSLFFNSGGVSSTDSWIGNVVAKNENNEDCDIYYNIFNKDPLFVNATNNDFNLTNGSPCIDAGNIYADSLLYYDFNNKCRIADGNNDGREFVDMGLFEFNSKFKTVIPISLGNDTLLCRNSKTSLYAPLGFKNYSWSNFANTSSITTGEQGEYRVCVSNDSVFGVAKKYILSSSSLFANDIRFNNDKALGGDPGRITNTIQFADVDNDDDLDIIYIANRRVNLMKNTNGKFTFVGSSYMAPNRANPNYGNDWDFGNIIAKDLDNDGNIEIVATMSGGYPPGDSTIVFSCSNGKLFNVKNRYSNNFLQLVDFNNDGLIDSYYLLGTNYGYGANIRINKGSGVFEDFSSLINGYNLNWIDVNSDGYKDAFALAYGRDNNNLSTTTTNIRNNNKDLTFGTIPITGLTSTYMQGIGDFNNDGKIDLIAHNSDGNDKIMIFKNQGNYNFTDTGVAIPTDSYTRIVPIDYNNDGLLDYMDGNDGSIYQNNGGFNFTKKDSKTGISKDPNNSEFQNQIKVADFNNDNSLDLFYEGKIYLNNECKKNTPPSAPTNITATMVGNTLKLSWDRAFDLEQGQNGLSYNFYVGSASGKDDIVCSNSNLKNGYRKIVEYGNASLDTFAIVTNLPNGTYYFGVQAIDNSFVGGNFSIEKSFKVEGIIINASPSIVISGMISGTGRYEIGSIATLVAPLTTFADFQNYTFVNWTENNELVSTNPNYTFSVVDNRNLIANYQLTPTNSTIYTISVSADNIIGTAGGGGFYVNGTSTTVVAVAYPNYIFQNWTENGMVVSTSASYTFTVSGNRTLVANFRSTITGLDLNQNDSFNVYPNPVKNELIIEFDGTADYEVVNMTGQIVLNGNLIRKTILQTSTLKPGIYFVKLNTGKTFEYTKIVKE